MEENSKKVYFLDRDHDCHWYIVEADKREEWNDWLNLNSDDERSWDVPDFAIGIDGPWEIEFYRVDID